jgi:hypothetical protein
MAGHGAFPAFAPTPSPDRPVHPEALTLPRRVRLLAMSQRLELILDDSELEDIQRLARERQMSAAEWVRGTLRAVRQRVPSKSSTEKLNAVRRAVKHSFPTVDIDQMLREIEQGYGGEPPA